MEEISFSHVPPMWNWFPIVPWSIFKSSLWTNWSRDVWDLLAFKVLLWHFSEANMFLKLSKKTPKDWHQTPKMHAWGGAKGKRKLLGAQRGLRSGHACLSPQSPAPQMVLKHPGPAGDLTHESPSLFQHGVGQTREVPTSSSWLI